LVIEVKNWEFFFRWKND